MTRNLKALGLALVAVFALSAVVASAATAAPKLTPEPEEYPVTVKASQSGTNVFELEGGRKTECANFTLEGTIKNKEEAEKSELNLFPTSSECTTTILGNKDPSTITWNGCWFRFTISEAAAGAIAAEGWQWTGTLLHLECPVGAVQELHVYSSAANHLANTPLCTYHSVAQTPGGDVDYRVGLFKWTVVNQAATRTAGTLTNCGGASQTGTMSGEVKFELFNSKGEALKTKFDKE
ncbi:MAG TPA: hypothetical protein VHA54_07950 [Solirubrobacterales bacterium]|nr:hypothetical protein [Solirubrobacterales bacterium]